MMISPCRINAAPARRSRLPIACATLVATIAATSLVTTATPTHAAAPFTWSSSSNTAANSWHATSTGANYSRATATTFADPGATAYLDITGVGAAQAPQKVTTTFSARRVIGKCKWGWYGNTGPGRLTCSLS